MTVICCIGDIHGNYDKLEEILSTTDADLYLQVGDFVGSKFMAKEETEYKAISKPVYFVPGNHCLFDELEPYNKLALDKVFEIRDNLWYIPLGHSFVFKGIKIVGFGGNYSKKRYEWNRKQLQHERKRHYVKTDFEKCLKQNYCDILLTHEPPTPFPWRGSDAGSAIVTSLITQLRPKLHFCGHMHIYREQMVGDCKSYCIPIHDYRLFEV